MIEHCRADKAHPLPVLKAPSDQIFDDLFIKTTETIRAVGNPTEKTFFHASPCYFHEKHITEFGLSGENRRVSRIAVQIGNGRLHLFEIPPETDKCTLTVITGFVEGRDVNACNRGETLEKIAL